MDVTVGMHVVVFGLIASLALLCAVIYANMRNQSALIWLTAALSCGGLETVLLDGVMRTALEVAGITILVPAAYVCLSQTVRAMFRLPSMGRHVFGAVAALTALSLGFLVAGAPSLLQSLPFQIAGAIALFDTMACLYRQPGKDILDKSLLAVLFCMAAVVLARMPLFPELLDGTHPAAFVNQSALQRILLAVAMFTTPTSVLLIIAKIVAGVIADHREHSERDFLTGLPNRRSFERSAARNSRSGGALIVCDIDNFKRVNDLYGHAVGDDVIRVFASLLDIPSASPARIGGEEFAILLPGATAQEAGALANAIRERFHTLRHPSLGRDHLLSASFGVSQYEAGVPARSVLTEADDALYRAKNEGRNRVVTRSLAPAPAAPPILRVA